MRRLATDYTYNFERVAPFFEGDPADPSSWTRAIERARELDRNRDGIVGVLQAQQEQRAAPEASRAAALSLLDATTMAIVTGQQAGLFGGPLYTLLKAITCIQLARWLKSVHDVDAVPVFWIDAEDHDWNEVASCVVLDAEFQPTTITLHPPPQAGEVPVAAVHLDEAIESALRELKDALPATEFTGELLERLSGAYRPGRSMSEAFGRWLESLLGAHGLVVFDSADPAAKPLVSSIFAREIETAGTSGRLAGEAGSRLAAGGYHAQVTPQTETLSLFQLDGRRLPIRLQGDAAVISGTPVSKQEMLARASSRPAGFSPNVLLRPVVQDALFPTVAYVAGPNELGYLAQLREIYQHFGVPMPLLYPRATATVIDSATARFLTRYKLPLEALQAQDDSALNKLLEALLPPAVDAALREATRAIEERMQALIEAVPAIDPTLVGAARQTQGRLVHELQALHNKVIQATKRRDDTLRRQFSRARALVFPGGQLQERAIGFVTFLNKYGPALVDRLLDDLPLEPGQHWGLVV